MIEVQSYILFLSACFFMVLFLKERNNKESDTDAFLGAVAAVCWIVLGFLWLFLAAESTGYGTYAVSFLFNGIGILTFILVLLDRLKMKSLGRTIQ